MSSGDRLSGLDSSFLHLEDGPAHMHVASALIFEGDAPHYDEFREHISSRLHLVPRFRQKLRFVPFGQGRPIWVDDPQFNLRYHVRHTALPAPGSEEQLRTLAARVFSQRLDRTKPVWELWLVDGMRDGRFAVIGKSHHCLVDGVAGMDITTVLFDAQPDPPDLPEPEPWMPEPEPTDAQILARALTDRAVSPAEAVRGARAGISAPSSPFNVDISPYRRCAWVRTDLGDLKRVKAKAGTTVNDVVLAAVAGALGRYMRARGHATSGQELKAMVPISVRTADEEGRFGNQVSAMYAPLPIGIEDPAERLAEIAKAMGDLKESKQAVGASILTGLADFAPTTILGQAGRIQSRQRFFNMVVTNVPGPQFALYLMGRRLREVFPMVPLAKRQAVCFGVMSYDGSVNFGLVGDYDAMGDLDDLAADLEDSIAELVALAPAQRTRGRRAKNAQRAAR